jgi:transposase
LAWRFVLFQKESILVRWYHDRVAGARGSGKKTFIVALARKLLIALWRYTETGEIPQGVALKPA